MKSLSLHAKPFPDDALKKFLLHENILVRETVAFYLYESWSPEDDLIPLVLESCRRFGEEASFAPLGCALRFRWSSSAVLDAIEALERSQPPYLEAILARAPLGLIRNHEEPLRAVLSSAPLARIERRRMLAALSTDELWRRLKAAANRFDEQGADRDEQQAFEDLEEALASRESRRAVIEKVHELDALGGFRLKLSLIHLAGAMHLHELSRTLIDCLARDDDDLAAAAAESLARIGAPWVVRRIREQYRDRSWVFRLYGIGAIQPIKSQDAERTLRALLEIEDDPALRGRLFDALRFHFTEASAELMRDEIRAPSSWMCDEELKKALWVNARILGRRDPEAEAWMDDDGIVRDGILFHIPVMDLGS